MKQTNIFAHMRNYYIEVRGVSGKDSLNPLVERHKHHYQTINNEITPHETQLMQHITQLHTLYANTIFVSSIVVQEVTTKEKVLTVYFKN